MHAGKQNTHFSRVQRFKERSVKHNFDFSRGMKGEEGSDGGERSRHAWLLLSCRSSEEGPGGTPYLAAEFAVLKAVQGETTREVSDITAPQEG